MKVLLMVLFSIAISVGLAREPMQTGPGKGEVWLQLDIEKKGIVNILLNTAKAPKTTAHIIKLTESGFYDQQRFFRVVKSPRPYLVQTGDPASKDKDLNDASMGVGGTGTKLAYEDTGASNVEGAVGLSTIPNQKDTGDCQFYILLSDNSYLDGSYTVFGKVVGGLDIVKKIELGDRITKASILRG